MEYDYEVSLKVKEHGERSFRARAEADDQDALARSLTCDLARMLGIMNVPPSAADITCALSEYDDTLPLMAYLYSKAWSGCHDFDAAFSVTVNLDVLMEELADDEKAAAARRCRENGWTVILTEPAAPAKAEEDEAAP